MNDSQFLKQEEAKARAAMAQTIADMKHTLGEVADPRTWVRQFPWVSMGSGLVLGFLGGAKATPAPGETLKEKWEEMKEAFEARRERLRKPSPDLNGTHSKNGKESPRKKSFLALLLAPLLRMVVKAMAQARTERVVKIVNIPPGEA